MLSRSRLAAHLVWQSGRGVLVASLALSPVRGLLPVVWALCLRDLINDLSARPHHSVTGVTIALVVTAAFSIVLPSVTFYLQRE